MANKFWVGGGSTTNWTATANTNWALTSGGANNAAIPVTGDDVIFDANSGTGASVWNVAISLNSLVCTGSKNVVTQNTTIVITISGGNLILPTGVGGSYTANTNSAGFTFTATSGTQQIRTNGGTIGAIIFSGNGGTYQLQDNLTMLASSNSLITLTAGTFDCQTFTVNTPNFVSNVTTFNRAIVGSGSWTIGAANSAGIIWNVAVGNFTVSGFSGNLIITGTTVSQRQWQGSTLVYSGQLIIGANTGGGTFQMLGSPTFGGLQIAAPNSFIVTAANLTFTTAPTITGSSGNEIYFASNTADTSRAVIVNGGAGTFTWCSFRDLAFSGTATLTATNSFDLGHNTGITITAPSGGSGGSFSAGFF